MQNKVILITGGAKRIGAALARDLHRQGASVIVHYHQSKQQASELVEQLNLLRAGSAALVQGNLSEPDRIQQLAQQVEQCFDGRLDVLINNASSFYAKDFGANDQQDWQQLIGSNAQGPYFLTQALLPLLKASQGTIINMVDINVFRPLNHYSLYCMAKAALTMMTESLAVELAPLIRVNGIAPGAILWPEDKPDLIAQQQTLSRIPLQRLGSTDDICGAASFLIQAPYITGQILAVDGGKNLVQPA